MSNAQIVQNVQSVQSVQSDRFERLWDILEFIEGDESMSTGTEIAKNTKNQLPANLVESAWGSENTSQADLLIPRIMLQQPLSDFVAKGKASPGDIVESINGEVLAAKGGFAEIIPITTFKTWIRYQMIDSKWQFLEQIPWSLENANLQYEEKIDGVLRRNDACLNFFVLIASRLTELPYLLAFKRSSYYAGKKLSTHFQVSNMKHTPPAKTVFKLSSQLTTVDKNSFWTLDVTKARDSKKEELEVAYDWYRTLSASHAKIDETSEAVPF